LAGQNDESGFWILKERVGKSGRRSGAKPASGLQVPAAWESLPGVTDRRRLLSTGGCTQCGHRQMAPSSSSRWIQACKPALFFGLKKMEHLDFTKKVHHVPSRRLKVGNLQILAAEHMYNTVIATVIITPNMRHLQHCEHCKNQDNHSP
jgi:hypothetical protein